MYLRIMSENEAKQICEWEYDEEYSVYNYSGWEDCKEEEWAITIKESREREFFSAFDEEDNLIGYIRLSIANDLVMIGIGLEPDMCGKGLGREVVELGLLKSNEIYNGKKVILMVKEFNERAKKCYIKSGFKLVNNNFTVAGEKYLTMEYKK